MTEFIEHPLIKRQAIETRPYQTTLSTTALEKGNTLVVAPTALGKTIIAIVLAVQLLEKKNGKVLFLAPTKPLGEQHKKTFEEKTRIEKEKIVLLTGSIPPKKRAKLFEQATIINATPQTIRNDLKQDRISLRKVRLCIFDECHRAVGNYCYVFIAKRFVEESNGLILGLTASPGSSEEKIRTVCENLFIENIEVKTPKDKDVKPFVKEIETEWVKVRLPSGFLKIKSLLEAFAKEQLLSLKKIGVVSTANTMYFNRKRQLELQEKIREKIKSEGKRRPILYTAATKLAALMKASHALLLLETQGISALNDYLDRAKTELGKPSASRALKVFLKSSEVQKTMLLAKKMQDEGAEHPKLEALKRILASQFKAKPESRAIVFNHYRSSIKKLVEFLKTEPAIKPRRFIGQATKDKDKGMSQKEQVKAIQELKQGVFNCLVASSVAEEGLDIPAVDLVVFYEPVPSEIRAIQRRGRTGRLSKGKVIVLMAEKTRDEAFYWVSFHKEKRMHRALASLKNQSKEKQTTLRGWSS